LGGRAVFSLQSDLLLVLSSHCASRQQTLKEYPMFEDSKILVAYIAAAAVIVAAIIALVPSFRSPRKTSIPSFTNEWPTDDAAFDSARRLSNIPLTTPNQADLVASIMQLFSRRAFELHDEVDAALGLYAVVVTRIVWQREVNPRLSSVNQNVGIRVLEILDELTDLLSQVCKTSPQKLHGLVSRHFTEREAFVKKLNKRPLMFETNRRICKRRRDLLERLRTALNELKTD